MTSTADLRVSSLFDFRNHVVLVTGGATGLGEMAAQGFVQNGAKVFIASRKESELKKTTDRINAIGPGKCEYIVADLKDKAGCDGLVKEIKKRTDRLTVLVNNTGVTWGAPYDDFPESGWDKLMALNVKSIFYMTVGLHDLLLKGTNADMPSRVINIASMAGIQTTDVTASGDGGLSAPGHGTYSCTFDSGLSDATILTSSLDGPSKAACIHLTKIQASKGVFPSRMTNFGIQKYMDTLLERQPTGRVGKPSDFAGLVLFLSSAASAHMTGNVIEIDGGSNLTGWRAKRRDTKI
ncbi:Rhamnolipids biosynthesis 3-oxoacyl-[acyl-carrier-protein] reductase [Cladophialophora carrionii]|uniref:Rhamnolipids biosynthesis 3-oxoacyl-[acyl-carrier-protein] reductase n=1 Tax=Cladophialophora carrionii TaxID=86049 RepID=A0A1C1CN38_9EURO|nr:Rhamnolipids biosynthesis 3-oxoacyl-[acyl-carrier-protein] reductase [Cladophialophora carrionii]